MSEKLGPPQEREQEIRAPLDPAHYSTLLRLATDEKRRLVVGFGGGSAPGLCGNVALAEILEELGLRRHVRQVWGTSAGAVIGGAWATGTGARDIFELVRRLKRRGSVDYCWWRLLFSLPLLPFGGHLPDGLVHGRNFTRTIDDGLRVKTFEECEIPFFCIATSDDGEARRQVFRRGPLLSAIFASMSIPGVLLPPRRGAGASCGYHDGALVEKTPLISPIAEHARSGDERNLLLLSTHFGNDARQLPQRGFIARILQGIYATEELVWSYQLAEARGRPGVNLLVLNPHVECTSLFNFSAVDTYYLRSREVFKDLLQNARIGLSLGAQ